MRCNATIWPTDSIPGSASIGRPGGSLGSEVVGGKSGGAESLLVSPSGEFYFSEFWAPKQISVWVHLGWSISV